MGFCTQNAWHLANSKHSIDVSCYYNQKVTEEGTTRSEAQLSHLIFSSQSLWDTLPGLVQCQLYWLQTDPWREWAAPATLDQRPCGGTKLAFSSSEPIRFTAWAFLGHVLETDFFFFFFYSKLQNPDFLKTQCQGGNPSVHPLLQPQPMLIK